MNDIDYRVWDEHLQGMFAVERIEWDDIANAWRCNGGFHEHLMQYSGFRDHSPGHRKKIYKDDIVSWGYLEDGNRKISVVGMQSDIGVWGVLDKNGNQWTYLHHVVNDGYCEIIGNRHQNPTLLEEK